MNEDFRRQVIETLRRGDDLPREWAHVLFPPEKRECELTYFGKEREEDILAETMGVPLQPAATFGKNGNGWHNMLILGDNLQVLKTLVAMKQEGKLVNADGTPGVRLIYIDPPFASKQDFKGTQDQKAYRDKVAGAEFLEFLRKRLVLLRELMSQDGAIYVHLDNRRAQYVKVLLDEIFGENNFRNAIVWKRSDAHSDVAQGATHLGRVYDTIFYYVRSEATKLNPVYTELPESTKEKWYRHVEEGTGRRYNMGDTSGPGGAKKGNPYYEWNGITRYWRFSRERMQELEDQNLLAYSESGIAYIKRYLDDSKGVPLQDWWDDISMIRGIHQNGESAAYPTQKPEHLLERVIESSSAEGDLVLDAFVGSGTTCAVAEKLKRRWIGIDCGKLAIYTVQKRMLNLRAEIGNKGRALTPKAFTLYNAGLYDFATLKKLPWADWRFFALRLFGCKDEPHEVGGIHLDGKFRGASVLVFNHLEQPGRRIDEETVQNIHAAVGKKVGRKFFIIAPRGSFDFQQDYLDFDGVRYYALRIPYSVINELHHRQFTSLKQPSTMDEVNAIVEAVGFDFIQPPVVEWQASVEAPEGNLIKMACLRITKFQSKSRLGERKTEGNLDDCAMVLLDYDYNGEVFDFDAAFSAEDLCDEKAAWFPAEELGETVMAVFIDIHGNESRVTIPRADFKAPSKRKKTTK